MDSIFDDMALLLSLLFLVLLVSTVEADIKILDTPDGKMGPEPCVRVCSGVDKEHTGWTTYNGRVYKAIYMSGCDFVSPPVVTMVSASGVNNPNYLCPSFTVYQSLSSEYFLPISESGYTKEKMRLYQCRIYWTATGFTC